MATGNFIYGGYQHFNGVVMERHAVYCKPGLWAVCMIVPEGAFEFFGAQIMSSFVVRRSAAVDDFGTLVPVEVH